MSENAEQRGGPPVRAQKAQNLIRSAEAGSAGAAAASPIGAVTVPSPRRDAVRSTAALRNVSPCQTCKVRLRVSIFFDGTGNNLGADFDTFEHSNVARLFRSHPDNNTSSAIYAHYVPGLGTYFMDIGDPGDDLGMAMGRRGDDRLEWAMRQIEQDVTKHPIANITGLDIALFGFSRGAALARAFANNVQDRCRESGGRWLWPVGEFEARIVFMGLFDTVASVGPPASSSWRSYRIANTPSRSTAGKTS